MQLDRKLQADKLCYFLLFSYREQSSQWDFLFSLGLWCCFCPTFWSFFSVLQGEAISYFLSSLCLNVTVVLKRGEEIDHIRSKGQQKACNCWEAAKTLLAPLMKLGMILSAELHLAFKSCLFHSMPTLSLNSLHSFKKRKYYIGVFFCGSQDFHFFSIGKVGGEIFRRKGGIYFPPNCFLSPLPQTFSSLVTGLHSYP